jgi:hypothetical protein
MLPSAALAQLMPEPLKSLTTELMVSGALGPLIVTGTCFGTLQPLLSRMVANQNPAVRPVAVAPD